MTKYGAQKTVVDGVTFASKAEARRYMDLRLLERAGQIEGLAMQPAYDLVVNGSKVARYIADFSYVERGCKVVEDVKGVRTPAYILKKKLMKAIFGIDVLETGKGRT